MATNNLYDTLIELAHQQNITISESTTERGKSQRNNAEGDEFPEKMKSLKRKIQFIKQNNVRIIKSKDKLVSTALPDEEKQILQNIGTLCDNSYDEILKVKNQLEELNEIVVKYSKEYPDEPETYSKIYQKQFLIKQVDQIISETKKVQLLIQRFSINTSLKRIKALAPQLSEEQAQNLANKKNGFEQLMMSKVMGKASLRLKYRVDDIIDKNKSIQKLQKTVEDNLRLMNEISELVQAQGEMIDNIYENILNAKDYVEKAEVNLKKEKKKHKMTRKKKCCIILVAICILALIVTPIVLKVVNDNKQV